MTTPISVDFDIEAEALANPRDLSEEQRLAMVLRRAAFIFDNNYMIHSAKLCHQSAAALDRLSNRLHDVSLDLLSTDSPSEP